MEKATAMVAKAVGDRAATEALLNDATFAAAVAAVRSAGLSGALCAWVRDFALRPWLRATVVPALSAASAAFPADGGAALTSAAEALSDALRPLPALLLLSQDEILQLCRAAAFAGNLQLRAALCALFGRAFSAGDSRALSSLGAAGLVAHAEDALHARLCAAVEAFAADACARFDVRALGSVCAWTERVAGDWLAALHPSDAAAQRLMRRRLTFRAAEAVARARTAAAFEALQRFPASVPALEDLRECMGLAPVHEQLRVALVDAVSERLLNVGASTADILHAFAKAVKALRVVDPSGVLLAQVAAPIREYLASRKDTVQCVVDAFVRESSADISEALRARPAPPEADPESWTPAPIVPDSPQTSVQPAGDVVAMLESLWGGSDAFVEHYAAALASALLTLPSWDTQREMRQLEALQTRFGDAAMQNCEVMLRDVSDSKRLALQLPAMAESFEFVGTIISHMYWPEGVKEEDEVITQDSLPPAIVQAMERFSAEFARLKPNRVLQWLCAQGDVTLEVEVNGSPAEFTVSPTLAAFVTFFSEKSTWSTHELTKKLGISADATRRSALFWMSKGVIHSVPGTDSYSTTPKTSSLPEAAVAQGEDGAQDESMRDEGEADEEKVERLDVDGEIAGLITGLLATGTGMTQRELCAEVAEIAPEVAPPSLRALLKEMVACEKLSFAGERYSVQGASAEEDEEDFS